MKPAKQIPQMLSRYEGGICLVHCVTSEGQLPVFSKPYAAEDDCSWTDGAEQLAHCLFEAPSLSKHFS